MRLPTKAEIASRLRSVRSKESKGKTHVDLENEAALYSLEKLACVQEATKQVVSELANVGKILKSKK